MINTLKIKELRRKKNISVSDMAQKLGVKDQTIYAYEKGIVSPPLDKAILLAEFLEISLEEIILKNEKSNSNEIIPKIAPQQEESFLKSQIERWQNEAEHWRKIAFEKLGILEKFRVYPSVQV